VLNKSRRRSYSDQT